MISIITNIHNQLAMNQLFYESVVRTTQLPFELIVIDNQSSDGSTAFFQNQPNVRLIINEANYNYPYCQNQGITVARFPLLCFFNNDILLSKNWDVRIVEVMDRHPQLLVCSVATNEQVENKAVLKSLLRRWKWIKYPLQALFGNRRFSLKWMAKMMYGDFDQFAEKRFEEWQYQLQEGYSGSAIIIKKEALLIIGLWDEQQQGADFDLFNRVKKQALAGKSILPIQLILGVYFHHYQRLTSKSTPPPFFNAHQMKSITDKWGNATDLLRRDIGTRFPTNN